MKIIYSDASIESLNESIDFWIQELSYSIEKAQEIRDLLVTRAENLSTNPHLGKLEEDLEELNQGHRRLVEGHCKIIYLVFEDYIYITDFFDTRQDPNKMKG